MEPVAFEEAWQLACESDVLLSPAEGRALFEHARRAPDHVVEVGSFHGGSAVLMGLAGARKLTLVEPAPSTELIHSLAQAGLLHRVQILPYPDTQVWHLWTEPISFFFLDHEHTYISARNSLLAWRRHLRPGTVVAVHDIVAFPEVKIATDELAPALEMIEQIENLALFTWR